jgi:hypothetical protein
MKSGCSYNDVDKLLWMLLVIVFDMLEAITNAFVMGECHKVVAMPILNIPIGKTNHHFIKTLYKHKIYECKSIIGFNILLKKKFIEHQGVKRNNETKKNHKTNLKFVYNLIFF